MNSNGQTGVGGNRLGATRQTRQTRQAGDDDPEREAILAADEIETTLLDFPDSP